MISDDAFRIAVIVLLAIVTLILLLSFIGGILAAIRVMQLKDQISQTLSAAPQLSQNLQQVTDQAAAFIRSVPSLLTQKV